MYSARLVSRFFRQIIHFRAYILSAMHCDSLPSSELDESESMLVLDSLNINRMSAVCTDFLAISPDNIAYLEDIKRDRTVGFCILSQGNIIQYGFLFKQNRMSSILGLPTNAVRIGHSFTLPDYRGQGYQGRSVLARAHLARELGFDTVVAESAPDNEASRRGMAKVGMQEIGRMDLVVLLRFFVIRWRRPPGFRLFGWCFER